MYKKFRSEEVGEQLKIVFNVKGTVHDQEAVKSRKMWVHACAPYVVSARKITFYYHTMT